MTESTAHIHALALASFNRYFLHPDKPQAQWSAFRKELWEGRGQDDPQGYQQGYRDAYQENFLKGRQEGAALILLRQLVHRFGPLGAEMTERVRHASEADLERWTLNFVDARTLEEVFGTP